MQDDTPPPPRAAPPHAASYPPPPLEVDDGASAARVDASVRSARRLAAWVVGLTAAGVFCCGGGSVILMQVIRAAANEQESKLEGAERDARMRQDTEELLQSLADGLFALGEDEELPEALPEAPPRDAWGTPVRYKRGASDATLTSSGRDRKFGTRDDIVRRVEGPK